MGGERWTETEVDRLVARTFLGAQSEQDNNLQFVRDMLTKRAPEPVALLKTYRDIRRGRPPVVDEEQSLIKSHLKLSGVVKRQGKALQVRNRVYRQVFDRQWIKEHLPENLWQRLKPAMPIIAGLLVVAIIMTGLTWYALDRQTFANAQLKISQVAQRNAEQQAERAKVQEERAKQSALEANREREKANQQTQEARKQAQVARRQTQIAEEFRQRSEQDRILAERQTQLAKEQSQLALARQLAAQAGSVQNEQSYLLSRSMLLAVESLRRLPSVEADQALRSGLSLLAPRVRTIGEGNSWRYVGVDISSDGQYAIVNNTEIVNTMTGEMLRSVNLKNTYEDKIDLSPHGRYFTITSSKTDDSVEMQVFETSTGYKIIGNIPNLIDSTRYTFSPNEQYLLVWTKENSIELWKTENGQKVEEFSFNQSIEAFAISEDERYLFVGDVEKTVHVIEIAAKQTVNLSLEIDSLNSLVVSPNGRYLIVNTTEEFLSENEMVVVDVQSRKEVFRLANATPLKNQASYVQGARAAVSPDSQYIAVSIYDPDQGSQASGKAQVLDISAGRKILETNYTQDVVAAAFSSDGKQLAISSGFISSVSWTTGITDYAVSVWDITTAKESARIIQNHPAKALAFSLDGKYLTTQSSEKAQLWGTHPIAEVASIPMDKSVSYAALSSDASYLALVSPTDKSVYVLSTETGQLFNKITVESLAEASGNYTSKVVFSEDGKYIITNAKNSFELWEVSTGQKINSHRLTGHDDIFMSREYGLFSPNGKYIADILPGSEKHGNIVRVTDIITGQEIFRGTNLIIESTDTELAFSANGRFVAAITEHFGSGKEEHTFRFTAQVWEVLSGREVGHISDENRVANLAISSDGRYLSETSSRDNIARIWKVSTGQLMFRASHENALTDLSFSPDSKYLATGGRDGKVRLWQIANGKQIAQIDNVKTGWTTTISGYPYELKAFDFSLNGIYLYTFNVDDTLRLSLWRSQDLINVACSRLTRNLTENEWLNYVGNEPYRKTCPDLPGTEPTSRG